MSHRLSGQISQMPDFTATFLGTSDVLVPNTVIKEEDEDENAEESLEMLNTPMGEIGAVKWGDAPDMDRTYSSRASRVSAPKSRKMSTMSTSKVEELVIIPKVDNEGVADAIGVLITGIRMILMNHEGNYELVFFS
jgi:hypothetical protein